MSSTSRLDAEACAFDQQITERVRNGHIPDLRRCEPCDYFYNNSWRRPEYVQLDFGEQLEVIVDALRRFAPVPNGARILEVGCGPGHMSLELARTGFAVVGLDISPVCIDVARRTADQDPWAAERGDLSYLADDFFTSKALAARSFDAIVFIGSLHHFREQHRVMRRCTELLLDNGIILAHEPTRDRVTAGNAAFITMLRVLLSLAGGYHRHWAIPTSQTDLEQQIAEVLAEMTYESAGGEKVQSVHDNDAGHAEMYGALSGCFSELCYRERYAYFHELIGGLRFTEATNVVLARYLRDMDSHLCNSGVLQPTEFFFAGRKKGE